MSSVNATSNGILIVVKFGNVTFTSSEITNFDLINSINGVPQGQFYVNDKNSDFLKQKSGDYGMMLFRDTTGDGSQSLGAIPFIIDEFAQESDASSNTLYRIKWSAGFPSILGKKSYAFKGSSFDAILDIAKQYEMKITEFISTTKYNKPSDSMTWRCIQSNMWESLTNVVNHSYLKNDYLYWAYDETKDNLKLSTLGFEKARETKYLMMYSTNAYTSTDETKLALHEPDVIIWSYDTAKRSEEVGKSREYLFPNVSFSGTVDTEVKQAQFKKACFSDVLKSMGDDKQETVLKTTSMSDKTTVYGQLKVKRHYPNNGHKMYSIADTYRDYKFHTYNKILYLTVYNSLGPPLGSKCSVIVNGKDMKIKGANIDETYTDTYILVDKYVQYTTNIVSTTGRTHSSGNAKFMTTLRLVSDNMGMSGYQEVMDLFGKIGK